MNSNALAFRIVVALPFVLCGFGPHDRLPGGASSKPLPVRSSSPGFLPSDPISAVSGSANETCDVSGTLKDPVGGVVRLRLKSALLKHLVDGTAAKYFDLDTTMPASTPKQIGSEQVDDDSSQSPKKISKATDPTISPTRLDIDLSQGSNGLWAAGGAHGWKPILLKIMLEDNGLTFISPNGTDSSVAVQTDTVTNGLSQTMFDCRQPIVTTNGKSWVQFRVHRLSFPATGSLNIGVIGSDCNPGPDCFIMPIVLDPKVPNNG